MDDLISRSALISRFKQLQGSDTLANMFVSDVIKEVKNQPTSYNVDKVVEQLEARKTLAESIQEKAMDHAMFGGVKYMQPIVQTIEEDLKIVKAGGVNG